MWASCGVSSARTASTSSASRRTRRASRGRPPWGHSGRPYSLTPDRGVVRRVAQHFSRRSSLPTPGASMAAHTNGAVPDNVRAARSTDLSPATPNGTGAPTPMPGTAAPQGVSACSPLEAALQLASWGWPVFPLHEVHAEGACSCKKGKRCGKQAGKHPRVDGWQQQATTDPNTIRAWWRQWPHANVGVPTGPRSGLWVVGPDGPKGHAALADLERRHGVLPATPSSQTGSGGEHRFFRWPSGLTIANARNHRGVPIDIRGEGGLVVAPGSTNINGPYRWQAGLSPADVALADAPDWLLEWANAEPLLESDNGDAPEPESRAVWRLTATAGATPQERARAYLERCPPAV